MDFRTRVWQDGAASDVLVAILQTAIIDKLVTLIIFDANRPAQILSIVGQNL